MAFWKSIFSSLVIAAVFVSPVKADTTIRFGITSPQAVHWPHLIAMETGIFERHGLKTETTVIAQGSQIAMMATVAGSIDITMVNIMDSTHAIAAGAKMAMFRMMVTGAPADFIAQPAIKSIPELKGKRVMVGSTADITLVYLDKVLESAQMKRTDVEIFYGDPTPIRFAALEGKAIDAAVLLYPLAFTARRNGYTLLASIADHVHEPFSTLVTSDDWLSTHPTEVQELRDSYDEAVRWFYDPKNKDQAIAILMKWAKLPAEDAEMSYMVYQREHLLSPDGRIDPADVQKIMDRDKAAGVIRSMPKLTFVR